MNHSDRNRFKTAALAGAAMLATSLVTPPPAQADPTLAAVLGGTALAGLILHSSQPVGGAVPAMPAVRGLVPAVAGQQVGGSVYSVVPPQASPTFAPGPSAVIYSSVSPVMTQQPPQQPMGHQPQQAMGYPQQQAMGYPQQQVMGYPQQQVMGYPQQQVMAYQPQMMPLQQQMVPLQMQPNIALPASYQPIPQPYQAVQGMGYRPH